MRAVLHVDMDAFYASVEERDRPELRGQPLIVGGTSGRGVVAAASYAVRRFGVRSAMPLREALRLCPQAICVHPRMSRYQQVSAQIFAIFREFTPLVQGLSLDEAFLDVTGCRRLQGEPREIGAEIRRRIRARTGLCASVGVAPNKLLAKLGSELAKPDGLFCIGLDDLHEVLDPLPIERLHGIGSKSLAAVHAAGIRTVGDAARADERRLARAFGKRAAVIRELARGIDERAVVADREEQSLSAEQTFAADIRDDAEIERRLLALADRAAARLRAQGLGAGRVAVKIRRADFRTYTRQCALGRPSQTTATIAAAARRLFAAWRLEQPDAALRLLGVGAAQLAALRQADLFETEPPRTARLDAAVDDIRERFGAALLTRASLLERRPAHGSGSRRGST